MAQTAPVTLPPTSVRRRRRTAFQGGCGGRGAFSTTAPSPLYAPRAAPPRPRRPRPGGGGSCVDRGQVSATMTAGWRGAAREEGAAGRRPACPRTASPARSAVAKVEDPGCGMWGAGGAGRARRRRPFAGALLDGRAGQCAAGRPGRSAWASGRAGWRPVPRPPRRWRDAPSASRRKAGDPARGCAAAPPAAAREDGRRVADGGGTGRGSARNSAPRLATPLSTCRPSVSPGQRRVAAREGFPGRHGPRSDSRRAGVAWPPPVPLFPQTCA